jgi:hypothetical protein
MSHYLKFALRWNLSENYGCLHVVNGEANYPSQDNYSCPKGVPIFTKHGLEQRLLQTSLSYPRSLTASSWTTTRTRSS